MRDPLEGVEAVDHGAVLLACERRSARAVVDPCGEGERQGDSGHRVDGSGRDAIEGVTHRSRSAAVSAALGSRVAPLEVADRSGRVDEDDLVGPGVARLEDQRHPIIVEDVEVLEMLRVVDGALVQEEPRRAQGIGAAAGIARPQQGDDNGHESQARSFLIFAAPEDRRIAGGIGVHALHARDPGHTAPGVEVNPIRKDRDDLTARDRLLDVDQLLEHHRVEVVPVESVAVGEGDHAAVVEVGAVAELPELAGHERGGIAVDGDDLDARPRVGGAATRQTDAKQRPRRGQGKRTPRSRRPLDGALC